MSYLYGHGCHTLDQVISYFGKPDTINYDVRQLLGEGRFNDYFDLDMYYGTLKVSVKSSYFRVKERPSFVVYGKKGMFIKQSKDRQEEHLKLFYMPTNKDFGVDTPEHYGTLIYYDQDGFYHEEKVVSVTGTMPECMMVSMIVLLSISLRLLLMNKHYYKWKYWKQVFQS